MKLYHYITKGNSALTDGILSFARNPQADLTYYYRRSGADTHEGIIRWMESCFAGRSRGIRGFTKPIQWTRHSLNLKSFVDNADLFAIDLDALDADGRIEAVYVSPPVTEIPGIKESRDCDEILQNFPASKKSVFPRSTGAYVTINSAAGLPISAITLS